MAGKSSQKSLLRRLILIIMMMISCYFLKYVIIALDYNFAGNWRDLPLFNLITHPHLDTWKTFEELCEQENLNVESHRVTTEDGYVNQMYRVNKGKTDSPRPAVMVTHGLVDSSDTWVLNGRNNSIAFILADQDYDVWMPNTRGNYYSQEHVVLDSKVDKEYWDHGQSNMIAKYDIPAFIEYVLKETKLKKLAYIGHSQATQ